MRDKAWRRFFQKAFVRLLGIGFLLSFTPRLWAAAIALVLSFMALAMSGQFGWVFRGKAS